MDWLRRHALVVGIAVFGIGAFAMYGWAEYGYFCDQSISHHEPCLGFWSREHLHDWIYNMVSNWQSEALGVILVAILLKIEGKDGADRDAT